MEGMAIKGNKKKQWAIITGCVVLIGALIIAIPLLCGLNEDDIDKILTTAFEDPHNVSRWACIDLSEGEPLPGNIETGLLTIDDKGNFNHDVAALIKNGLITVRLNSAQGPVAREKLLAVATHKDISALKSVALSYVGLTQEGKKFYRYDDPGEKLPKGIAGTNRFCARIQYGGVENFTAPAKNPFDDNPHQVTWVNFRWKLDEKATPWLAGTGLVESVASISEVSGKKDGWMHDGITLERDDDGVWGLGKNPYAIRW